MRVRISFLWRVLRDARSLRKRHPSQAKRQGVADRWFGEFLFGYGDGHHLEFATTSNPAFPSVVCRSLVKKDGAFSVKTLFRSGAAKAECDRLVASYTDLDRKMREAIEKQKR